MEPNACNRQRQSLASKLAITDAINAYATRKLEGLSTRRFLVFMNARNSRVNVLYRRKSGDFGLIEPSLG